MFKVKKECCNQCLFSRDAIVSNKRRSGILRDCKNNDTYFICHKSTIKGDDTCCKGFYDTQTSNMIRISQRLSMVKFVD